MDIFSTSHDPRMFTGHDHTRRITNVMPYGVKDHTYGYFPSAWVTAVKASASKGIYSIAYEDLDDLVVRDAEPVNTTYTIQ